MSRVVLFALAATAVSWAAADPAVGQPAGGKKKAKVGPVPAAVRDGYKLDPFYAKYLDANGIPVLASRRVNDQALVVAADLVNHLLAKQKPEVRKAIVDAKVRVGVIGAGEETCDLPEYADLENPAAWNKRARGLGATRARPATSAGEENLLGFPVDRYRGESILIHEFAHTVHEIGLTAADETFEPKLKAAFDKAVARGKWANTYAGTKINEYWAEGVQSYFDANAEADPPDGNHNFVNTRAELKAYDPDLYKLINDTFKSDPWRWKPLVNGQPLGRPNP